MLRVQRFVISNLIKSITYKRLSFFNESQPTVQKKKLTMITRPQNRVVLLLIVIMSSLLTLNLKAETNESKPFNKEIGVFDALQSDDILDITIETNLSVLVENRRSEEYQKGMLTYEDSEGNDNELVVKLRPRGKFRRRICDFPPLKLKFPKKHLQAAGLAPKYNDLKLVTHCLDAKSEGKINVIKELLAYKMYQELTSNSYRVQLVRITYIDSNKKMGKMKRYGFLIEDTDEMVARVGGKEYEQLNPDPSIVSAMNENTMAVFQYMIGNADYNLAMLRNLKLVQPKNGGELIPVPYDFDFSGFVNTAYAKPNVDYGLKSVRDRYFLGLPVEDSLLKRTFSLFKVKRKALEKIIQDQKGLSRNVKDELLDYIGTFYNSLDDITESNERNLYAALKSTISPERPAATNPILGK